MLRNACWLSSSYYFPTLSMLTEMTSYSHFMTITPLESMKKFFRARSIGRTMSTPFPASSSAHSSIQTVLSALVTSSEALMMSLCIPGLEVSIGEHWSVVKSGCVILPLPMIMTSYRITFVGAYPSSGHVLRRHEELLQLTHGQRVRYSRSCGGSNPSLHVGSICRTILRILMQNLHYQRVPETSKY
jgi:hypothetical protein